MDDVSIFNLYFLCIKFHKKFIYNNLSHLTSNMSFKNEDVVDFKLKNMKTRSNYLNLK